MRYIVGIPYVNRKDLLYRAIDSIRPYWGNTFVLDNSAERELKHDTGLSRSVTVYEPPVPLTFTQSMNWFQRVAAEREADAVFYMHNDAEAHPGTPEAFLGVLEDLMSSGRKWGLALTNFDALAAYNMEAVRAAGPWDTIFSSYFADIDYHRRLRLAGYDEVFTGLPVEHHGSSTRKSDSRFNFIVDTTWPLYERYYELKWGGKMAQETYLTPFNLP
ncbi:glycosyltransferase family 2 protein [Paenibacillus apiarius]|uniref:Glycosyltransferase family 2 protein n=1 Tax=Paenibacillus apiarius TaxID=46240 RepID=A0ABT4DR53_9BACL|nr:glycosyltransferase [Paenibacillus apiarius]MCY9512562.1 glycosyltransferase family 2 protein [Paenibacillus apiarius]MCY9519833.1 glycosyltransferase family 2 protein [Paenibacillus apiarius]MCY9553150.1 glycosyltransferase family 2 protein [Paenibacillus apiarius]MCY9559282.1 glycosyltransferase family 2 protein [Paenibacillus apiarius]MCY9682641.1 glycosyltransferase family 2 protein [Paenibacillus apiarius]